MIRTLDIKRHSIKRKRVKNIQVGNTVIEKLKKEINNAFIENFKKQKS